MTSWRRVRGFEAYEVSDDGTVRSYKRPGRGPLSPTPVLLTPRKNSDGYHSVVLSNGTIASAKQFKVHRLVAEAFLDRPGGDAFEVNHKDGVKSNNRLENLEWVTKQANINHATATGLRSHRLTADIVLAIADDLRQLSRRQVAEKYGVSYSRVTDIEKRTTWKHVLMSV